MYRIGVDILEETLKIRPLSSIGAEHSRTDKLLDLYRSFATKNEANPKI